MYDLRVRILFIKAGITEQTPSLPFLTAASESIGGW